MAMLGDAHGDGSGARGRRPIELSRNSTVHQIQTDRRQTKTCEAIPNQRRKKMRRVKYKLTLNVETIKPSALYARQPLDQETEGEISCAREYVRSSAVQS